MSKHTIQFSIGILTGLISPVIGFVLFAIFKFPEETLLNVLGRYQQGNVLTHVISLSVLINLPLFFLFLQFGKETISKGIIGSTFIYTFLVLIMQLL